MILRRPFSYYLVASAILAAAYTSAINGKHYGLAVVVAIAGLGLRALTAAVEFYIMNIAGQAGPAVIELQNRIAGRLKLDSVQAGMPPQRRVGSVTFGLAALVNISALVYAVTLL